MVKKLMRVFLSDPIFNDTIFVTASMFVGNILAYALQLYLGRTLSISEYGEFNVLLSLVTVTIIPSVSLNTAVIKVISNLITENATDLIAALFDRLSKFLLIFGIGIGILFTIFSSYLVSYFQLSGYPVLNAFTLFLSFAFLSSLPGVFLQGNLKFKSYATLNLFALFLRLIFPIILVSLGYGIVGVFIGMFAAMVVSYVCGLLALKLRKVSVGVDSLRKYTNKITKLMFTLIYINIGLILLNNIDILLVKHYFSQETAGIYSAVVTVGKIVFFGTSAVSIVMLPKISNAFSAGKNFYTEFKRFIVVQLLILIPAMFVFIAFPKLIIQVLFPRFSAATPYIPAFTVFIGVYVFVNFVITFMLSIDQTRIWQILIPFVMLQAGFITLFHQNLFNVIYVNIAIVTLLLLCLVTYFTLLVKPKISKSSI